MKRVMIVGGPGSGKSTLARMLGGATGLPVFHMDHIHWKPGWVERTAEEKYPLVHDVITRDAWIFEGNNSRTFAERFARADTCIWLDMPLPLRVWRVMRRTITTLGQTRPDMSENCPERLNAETLRFLAFIWRTRHSAREKVRIIADNPPAHLTVVHLRSLGEVQAFLKTVPGCAERMPELQAT